MMPGTPARRVSRSWERFCTAGQLWSGPDRGRWPGRRCGTGRLYRQAKFAVGMTVGPAAVQAVEGRTAQQLVDGGGDPGGLGVLVGGLVPADGGVMARDLGGVVVCGPGLAGRDQVVGAMACRRRSRWRGRSVVPGQLDGGRTGEVGGEPGEMPGRHRGSRRWTDPGHRSRSGRCRRGDGPEQVYWIKSMSWYSSTLTAASGPADRRRRRDSRSARRREARPGCRSRPGRGRPGADAGIGGRRGLPGRPRGACGRHGQSRLVRWRRTAGDLVGHGELSGQARRGNGAHGECAGPGRGRW